MMPQPLIIGGLLLALLILSACQPASSTLTNQGSVPTSRSTPTYKGGTSTSETTSTNHASVPTPTPTPETALTSQGITPTPQPVLPRQSITPTVASNPAQRNHISPGAYTLFARITFTNATIYDQAAAIIKADGGSVYPWNCDDPRTPTPPPLAQQRATFAASHQLFVSEPSDNLLNQLASSPQVVSVDAAPMSMCP